MTEFNHKWQKTSRSEFPGKLQSRWENHSEGEGMYPSDEKSGYGKVWGLCDNCGRTFNLNKKSVCTFHFSASPFNGDIGDVYYDRCILKEGHKGLHATEFDGNSINWESETS